MKKAVRFAFVAGCGFFCTISPVSSQELLGSYTAIIGQQDLYNSSGSALEDPSQIIMQDRANFHRFGVRQDGDTSDSFFGTRNTRASMDELLRAGKMGPGVEEAIRTGSGVPLLVEIYGRAGRPEYLSLSLADNIQQTAQLVDEGQDDSESDDTPRNEIIVSPESSDFFATSDTPDSQGTVPTALPGLASEGTETNTGRVSQVPAPAELGPILPTAASERWLALVAFHAHPDAAKGLLHLWAWVGRDKRAGLPAAMAVNGTPKFGDPVFDDYVEGLVSDAAAAASSGPKRLEVAFFAGSTSNGMSRVLVVEANANSGLKEGSSGPARTVVANFLDFGKIELRLKNGPQLSGLVLDDELVQTIDAEALKGGRIVARLVIDADPSTMTSRWFGSQKLLSGTIAATVISFTLHAQAEGAPKYSAVPGRELASFAVPPVLNEEDLLGQTFENGSAAGLSALYGIPTQGDRLLAGEYQELLSPGTSGTGIPGHLSLNRRDPHTVLADAARLAAIAGAYPELPLAPDAQDFVLFSLMSGQERDALVPPELVAEERPDDGIGGNEFERARFYEANATFLRKLLVDRAPKLPLPMVWVWYGGLEAYDGARGGFPLRNGSGSNLLTDEPDLLPCTPEECESYLAKRTEASREQRGMERWAPMSLEYAVGPALVPPDVLNPITLEDAARVVLPITPQRIVAHVDSGRTEEFVAFSLSADTAPKTDQPEALLPSSTFESTSPGRLAVAALRLIGGEAAVREAVKTTVAASPQYTSLQGPAKVAEQMAEVASFPAESVYWIGAAVSLGDYDAATGRILIDTARPPDLSVYGIDRLWLEQPTLAFAYPSQLSALSVDPVLAERIFGAVSSSGLQLALRVTPASALRDNQGATLYLDIDEILVLREDLSGGQSSVVAALIPEAAAGSTETAELFPAVSPPDVLHLDHEALDLLHLKLNPTSMNDAGIDRMLVERFLREAHDVSVGAESVWGRFFATHDQMPTYPERIRLRQSFRGWSEARAAVLPDRIIVTVNRSSADAADYPCVTAVRWYSSFANHARTEAPLESVLSAESMAAALAQSERMVTSDTPSLAEGIFVLRHRPLHEAMRVPMDCPVLSRELGGRTLEGLDLAAASYADAVIDLRDAPIPAGSPSGGWYRETYLAELDEARFITMAPTPLALSGYRGEIVLTARATEGVFHDKPGGVRSGLEERQRVNVAALRANPAPGATTASVLDVAGLALDMAPDAFEASATALFDMPPVPVAGPDTPTHQMHTARGFVDPAGTQLVVGIHPPARPDGPLLAILRYTVYEAAEVSRDSLVAALREKYGTPTNEWRDQGRYVWGAPSKPDPMMICNPLNLAEPPPPLVLDPDPRVPIGSALTQPGYWQQVIDWPRHSDQLLQEPTAFEICGPVVFAAIMEEPAAGRLHLRVWLVDAASMARALSDPTLAPPETKPAKVKL